MSKEIKPGAVPCSSKRGREVMGWGRRGWERLRRREEEEMKKKERWQKKMETKKKKPKERREP